MIDILDLAFLAFVWVVGIVVPGYRTVRFLALVATGSVVIVIAQALSPTVRDSVRLAAVVVVALGVIVAERVGLGSLTSAELRLDRELQRAARLAATDTASRREAIAILDEQLHAPVSEMWRPGIRMQRRAWATSVDDRAIPFLSPTPSGTFALGAAGYLHDVRTRRVIGVRPRAGPIEESILLRAYLDDVRGVLPPGTIGPGGTTPGRWADDARATIDELRRVLLRDRGAQEVRDRVVELLEAELAMRVSGSTVADQARYDQISAELDEAWVRLDASVPDGSA